MSAFINVVYIRLLLFSMINEIIIIFVIIDV